MESLFLGDPQHRMVCAGSPVLGFCGAVHLMWGPQGWGWDPKPRLGIEFVPTHSAPPMGSLTSRPIWDFIQQGIRILTGLPPRGGVLMPSPSIWGARSLSSHHFSARHPTLRDNQGATTKPHISARLRAACRAGRHRWVTGGNSHGNAAYWHPKDPTCTPQRAPHRAPQPQVPGLSIVPVLMGGPVAMGRS